MKHKYRGKKTTNKHGEVSVYCSDGKYREEKWAKEWEAKGKPKNLPLVENRSAPGA